MCARSDRSAVCNSLNSRFWAARFVTRRFVRNTQAPCICIYLQLFKSHFFSTVINNNLPSMCGLHPYLCIFANSRYNSGAVEKQQGQWRLQCHGDYYWVRSGTAKTVVFPSFLPPPLVFVFNEILYDLVVASMNVWNLTEFLS